MDPVVQRQDLGLEVVSVQLTSRASKRLARHRKAARAAVAEDSVIDLETDVASIASSGSEGDGQVARSGSSTNSGEDVLSQQPENECALKVTGITQASDVLQGVCSKASLPNVSKACEPCVQRRSMWGSTCGSPCGSLSAEQGSRSSGSASDHRSSARSRSPRWEPVPLPQFLVLPEDDSKPMPGQTRTARKSPPSASADLPAFEIEAARPMGQEIAFYVEHLRANAGSPPCKACGRHFAAGALRLGYVPSGAAVGVASMSTRWLHAPGCIHADGLQVRPSIDQVAFSPAISAPDRNRVLIVMSMAQEQPTAASLMCPRPWRYMPAHLQRWPLHTVPPPGAPRLSETTAAAASSSSTLSAAARAALALEGRLHYERLATRRLPAPLEPEADARDRQAPATNLRSEMAQSRQSRCPSASSKDPPLPASLRLAAPVEQLESDVPPEEPCVICREPMVAGEEVRRLPCLHVFHRRCLEKWLQVKPICPLDNIPIEEMIATQSWMRNRTKKMRARSDV